MDIGSVIGPEILNLIAEIDEFNGAWLEKGKLPPERLSTLKRVATIESIGSSTRIEGCKLSDQQIEALLFFHCLQRQKQHLEVKLSQEKRLVAEHSVLALKILELLKSHGALSMGQITALTQGNRNTLKKTVARLVKEHYILQNGSGKATWYALKSFA